MIDFGERVVLITGAAGGIGAATARTIARCGGDVVLHNIGADRLEDLSGEVGDGAYAVSADLANPASAMTKTIARQYGRDG